MAVRATIPTSVVTFVDSLVAIFGWAIDGFAIGNGVTTLVTGFVVTLRFSLLFELSNSFGGVLVGASELLNLFWSSKFAVVADFAVKFLAGGVGDIVSDTRIVNGGFSQEGGDITKFIDTADASILPTAVVATGLTMNTF